MGRFVLLRPFLAFATFVSLALAPNAAFAQRSGGHSSGGGGGFHGGGGGGFGGGGFHGGGGVFGGSGFRGAGGDGFHGGGSYGGGRSAGAGGYHQGGAFRGGAGAGPSGAGSRANGRSEPGRSFGSGGNRLSNVRPAINDGQWHSFGNSGSSARLSAGRSSGSLANSSLSARSNGGPAGAWRSFGPSRVSSGFVGRGSVITPGFGWRGRFFPRWGWGGGCCWGWGFGFGWPWWGGGYWALGWSPWWYDPFWYSPWPAYSSYYDWDDYSNGSYNDPPYRNDRDANVKSDTKQEHGGVVQNGKTPQPEAAPDSAAPAAEPPSLVVSPSET